MSDLPSKPDDASPSVIQLIFRDKAALYAAYIPLFSAGGLFVPTKQAHLLGDQIYLLIGLPGDAQRFPIVGKVAWLTPANATGGRTEGIGVSFSADPAGKDLKQMIEKLLGSLLASNKPTQTI